MAKLSWLRENILPHQHEAPGMGRAIFRRLVELMDGTSADQRPMEGAAA